jgi:hypothetical protein
MSEITIENRRICEFYQTHPSLDIVQINLAFIDWIEAVSGSAGGGGGGAIIESMKSFQENVQQKLSEYKRESAEDIRAALSINTIERIAPIVKQHTDTIEHKIQQQMSDIKHATAEQVAEQKSLHRNLSDFLRKLENSSSKGKISENLLYGLLTRLYPSAELDAVGTVKETGDIMMSRKNCPQILFENKNYDKNVTQDEVRKFLRDVEHQNCCGIMMSQHSGIANKGNFEIGLHNGNAVVFLHNLNYDADVLRTAVDLVDHFMSCMASVAAPDTSTVAIPSQLLEDINREYGAFVANKIAQIKHVRDFSQKMISQIDELKIPSLEIYLGKNYSTELQTHDQCPVCDKYFKKGRPFETHRRACEKRAAAAQNV